MSQIRSSLAEHRHGDLSLGNVGMVSVAINKLRQDLVTRLTDVIQLVRVTTECRLISGVVLRLTVYIHMMGGNLTMY